MHKRNSLQGKYIAGAVFIIFGFNNSIINYENSCINNFRNKIYQIDLSRKAKYVNFTCESKRLGF